YKHRSFLIVTTVMECDPYISHVDTLPVLQLRGFRRILNSTTNVILTGMEQGLSFEQSLKHAQEIGIAETDPTHDVEGWDATVKVAGARHRSHGRPDQTQCNQSRRDQRLDR